MYDDNASWIPVSSGNLPPEGKNVQVTYVRNYDTNPHCDAFAHLYRGEWYWGARTNGYEEMDADTEITAWRPNCEPYGKEYTRDEIKDIIETGLETTAVPGSPFIATIPIKTSSKTNVDHIVTWIRNMGYDAIVLGNSIAVYYKQEGSASE